MVPIASRQRGFASTAPASGRSVAPLKRGYKFVVTARQSARSDLLDLTQWAISNGIKYAKVRPEMLSGGRGMVATFPISAGEALVSVPQQSVLRVYPGDSPPAQLAAVAELWARLPWYIKLACKLGCESRQGSSSRLAAPIAALPTSVDLLWPAEELHQLQCQHMIDLVTQQKQDWDSWYQQLSKPLTAAGVDKDTFFWALCISSSRTFAAPNPPASLSALLPAAAALQVAVAALAVAAGTTAAVAAEGVGLAAAAGAAAWILQQAQEQEQHVLCPLLDMFNHDPTETSCCELDVWSGAFQVAASRAWAPGQQVMISYGASSNDALLQLYGFVANDNPHDRYVMTDVASKLRSLATTSSSSSSIPAGTLEEITLQRQGLPTEVATALHQTLQRPTPSSSSSGLVPYGTCHPDVQSALAELLVLEQQGLPTTLVEDDQLLGGFQRLPAAQQQLQQVVQEYQQAQDSLASISEQIAVQASLYQALNNAAAGESQGAAELQGGSAAIAVADAQPMPPEEVYAMTAEERRLQQQLRQLQQQQEDLEAEVAGLSQQLAGVKPMAVQYRVQKKRLLQAVQQQLPRPPTVAAQ